MSISTTAEFIDAVAQLRILSAKLLDELKAFKGFPDARGIARECIVRNWLTVYQVNHIVQGKGRDLNLGSYILLERLGEGGMGQVFKAMHRNLGRVSAIKVIHKDRLGNPGVIKRFKREVQAAAKLKHPNIVLAYDADEIDGRHLLVMQYIDGATDLSKIVKQHGPMPFLKACDYLRWGCNTLM